MPRKAGKKRIAQALKDYEQWREKIGERASKIPEDGQAVVNCWSNEVKKRIEDGELWSTTTALIRSVVRVIEDFESGYYLSARLDEDGNVSFTCKGYSYE